MSDLIPSRFTPVWWARGPHGQTIMGHLANRIGAPEEERLHRIELDDGDALASVETLPDDPSGVSGVALLMHGLGGDAQSRYMLSATRRFAQAGWAVFRLNHRGAGQGAGLARRLYNCGLSGDVRAVIDTLALRFPNRPIVPVGYSMSGNTLLKYLGEMADHASRHVAGAVAVNPPINVGLSIELLEEEGRNRFYHRRFTKLLVNQAVHNAERSNRSRPDPGAGCNSIRQFDAKITAPAWGFADPDDYYRRASALPHLSSIRTPVLVLTSDDDPIVPADQFRQLTWPHLAELHITRGGGHMGYLSNAKTPFGDRRWLDYTVVEVAVRLARYPVPAR